MSEEQMVDRDRPETPDSRKALVEQWCKTVEEAEAYWEDHAFRRMRADMLYAKGLQWGQKQYSPEDERYTANIVLRHIRQRLAVLYAKNPRIVAKPKPRMVYSVWDEKPETLVMCKQSIAAAMTPQAVAAGVLPPVTQDQVRQCVQILQDYENGKRQKEMIDKVCRTLEYLFQFYLSDQTVAFKTQAKQLIIRVLTTGVGYIKVGYQRTMKRSPELENRIRDATDQLAVITAAMADLADGEIEPTSAQAEELKLMVKNLQSQFDIVVREGLVFDFPRSTAVIPDPCMTQFKGFVGCEWVAQKFLFTPRKIQEIYGVDVGTSYTKHDRYGQTDRRRKKDEMACVYEVYDKNSGMVYHVCKGYPEFLQEPAEPELKVQQFWPWVGLSFNDVEDEEDVIPPSDVHLLRPMQSEYNRSGEGRREHRIANRPAWMGAKGALSEGDRHKLGSHDTFEFIELDAVKPGTDPKTVIMSKPVAQVEPILYDTDSAFLDAQRVVGGSEPNWGGTSGSTATESTIAEQSRISTVQSNVDDLDDFLSQMAQVSGEVLLRNMKAVSVKRIVGPGAAWPEFSSEEIAEDIHLTIKAGSSGRPNKSQELANFERAMPFVLQIPGVKPRWLGEELLRRMDDGMDLAEAFEDGAPSIVARNQQSQPGTGDPATDPNQQGGEGGDNAQRPGGSLPGPQPMYPGVLTGAGGQPEVA
jgi:hypothetical protein